MLLAPFGRPSQRKGQWTGGKWTTYRKMAEDAIDYAAAVGKVPEPLKPCQTYSLPLLGAVGYHPALFTEIAQNYVVPHRPGAIDTAVAQHLTREAPVPYLPILAKYKKRL